ncbi:hypothetical protein Tco_1430396 [Tanacetum coccineum]
MVAFLKKPEGSAGFHQIVDFLNSTHIKYALTENPTIYVSFIHQFWQTTSASTPNNGEMEITATIDGRVKTVTEASIRRHIKLEDSDGISTLLNIEIFEQVTLMSSPPHTNVANEAASTCVDVRHGGVATTVTSLDAGHGSGNINKTPSIPHDSPLLRGHAFGSDEGIMQQNELIDLVTNLSNRCEDLETYLRQIKKVYGDAFTKLIKKVKTLEKTVKTSQARRRARVVISDDEESWRILPNREGRNSADTEICLDQEEPTELVEDLGSGKKGEKEVTTIDATLNTASIFVSTASPQRNADTNSDDLTLTETLMEIRKSKYKDAEWDDVLAKVAADEDFVQQLQAGEKCSKEDLPMKLVELVKENFEVTMRRVQSFVPMGSELEIREASGEEQSAEKEKGLLEKELQKLLMIVLVEKVFVEALQVRWQSRRQRNKGLLLAQTRSERELRKAPMNHPPRMSHIMEVGRAAWNIHFWNYFDKEMKRKLRKKEIAITYVEDSPKPIRSITTLQPLPTIDPKDKGKGVLVEEEPEKVKRRDQGALLAKSYDEIQARIDADHELVIRLTHEEQEKYTIKERARLLAEFFERRKKQLAAERAEAIRNKPPTRTQQAESTKKRPRADSEEESSKKQKLEEDNDAEKEGA